MALSLGGLVTAASAQQLSSYDYGRRQSTAYKEGEARAVAVGSTRSQLAVDFDTAAVVRAFLAVFRSQTLASRYIACLTAIATYSPA